MHRQAPPEGLSSLALRSPVPVSVRVSNPRGIAARYCAERQERESPRAGCDVTALLGPSRFGLENLPW